MPSLVGSEMCIRDRFKAIQFSGNNFRPLNENRGPVSTPSSASASATVLRFGAWFSFPIARPPSPMWPEQEDPSPTMMVKETTTGVVGHILVLRRRRRARGFGAFFFLVRVKEYLLYVCPICNTKKIGRVAASLPLLHAFKGLGFESGCAHVWAQVFLERFFIFFCVENAFFLPSFPSHSSKPFPHRFFSSHQSSLQCCRLSRLPSAATTL